jgi:MFS family permease
LLYPSTGIKGQSMEPARCRLGLKGLNFFIAAVQTGFGPFFSVYLTEQRWTQGDIGFALSIGTIAAVAFQLPAGALVDAIHRKRFASGLGLLLVGVSALLLLAQPSRGPVWVAQVIHGAGSCILTPAIAALTLALCGHQAFSENLGVNARYASLGAALGAGLLGWVAQYFSERTVFIATAAMVIPALAMLPLFRDSDRIAHEDHPALLHPRERRRRKQHMWQIFMQPALHVFAVSAVLFQVSNAAMLPLALNSLAQRTGQSGFVVSAAIIVPQLVVAVFSPWVGRVAQQIGRRPVLLIGFAALPLRGLLFMTLPDAIPLVALEVLDGVSAAVFGLMVPLIAADLTSRQGFLNLAIGSIALAGTLGAAVSTTVAGWITDMFGAPVAFLALAAVGVSSVVVITMMPETRPVKPLTTTPATATA